MQLAVTLGALFYILGGAAVGGLCVCVCNFPLNLVVMRRVKVLQDPPSIVKVDVLAVPQLATAGSSDGI